MRPQRTLAILAANNLTSVRKERFLGTILAVLFVLACHAAQAVSGRVENTKHNLSASGPGQVKSVGQAQVCVFCHVTHDKSSESPRWNKILPSLVYTPYSSPTMKAIPGQPTGTSKLCLSCHDGTVAPGKLGSKSSSNTMRTAMSARANLTRDLSDDHPISFVYDSALAAQNRELVNPQRLTGNVRLDAHGELQCTTCHDPHSDANPMFLTKNNTGSALCITCHKKTGWSGSSHALSGASWNHKGINPWPNSYESTVSANGCGNCHSTHHAGHPEGLLNYEREEDNCLSCHGGNLARTDISVEIQKPFRHDVQDFQGIHEPNEDFRTMPRHVECQDCHDPHASSPGKASPPVVGGALAHVKGVSISGAPLTTAVSEYEVCFRCHSDNTNMPMSMINRKLSQPNMRLKFQPSSPSFHPVAFPGRNSNVPSLISPLTPASLIYCTDCHNNDAGPEAGGTGPRGPHGSIWPHLLEREYQTMDNTGESTQTYALCYKCHDRASILGDRSFPEHSRHIVKSRTPCSACHDSHGISSAQGNPIANAHLINFDKSIVFPEPVTGRLEYRETGPLRGECNLSCHGKIHNPATYSR